MNYKDEIMSYMMKNFKGNTTEIARRAAEHAVKKGWVDGPLWDEIGMPILRHLLTLHINSNRREGLRPGAPVETVSIARDNPGLKGVPKGRQTEWVFVPSLDKWLDIMNVPKSEIASIISEYDKRSQANAFERDFWLEVGQALKRGQVVGDVFDFEKLQDLRREMAQAAV